MGSKPFTMSTIDEKFASHEIYVIRYLLFFYTVVIWKSLYSPTFLYLPNLNPHANPTLTLNPNPNPKKP